MKKKEKKIRFLEHRKDMLDSLVKLVHNEWKIRSSKGIANLPSNDSNIFFFTVLFFIVSVRIVIVLQYFVFLIKLNKRLSFYHRLT